MAFNPGINRDEEDEENQGAQQGGTNQLGSSGGVIGGQTAQEGQAQKGKGSGFTNIGSYLEANKDDIPGQTQAAVGKVGDKYNKATQSVLASQEAFNTQADQGRGAYVQGATSAEDARKIIGDNLRSDSVIDDNDRSTWASYANSQYKGPNELSNTFQPEATEAKDWSNTLAKSDGYFPMMGKMFGEGRSDYNTGMQRLDGSLISADKNARSTFDNFNQEASSGLDATVDSARQSAAQKAGQYQSQADWTKKAARDALEQDVLPEYMRGLAGQAQSTNAQMGADYQNARVGGGESLGFNVAGNFSGEQSDAFKDAMGKINEEYRLALDFGGGTGEKKARAKRDADMAALNALAYNAPTTISGTYSNPSRSDYVGNFQEMGIGGLDPSSLAKLEALYGMSGNQDLRSSLESEAAATLGFDDIMRGAGRAHTFDQSGYDQASTQSMQQAINAAMDAESRRREDLMAQQRAFNAGIKGVGPVVQPERSSGGGNTVVDKAIENVVQQGRNLGFHW